MRRILVTSLCSAALLAPAGDAAAQLGCNLGTATATSMRYSLCGFVDLDQIRPYSISPETGLERGLPGDGRQYCFPTTVMNQLVLLARAGLLTNPPPRDWESGGSASFDEMSGYIRDLGQRMGTSPTAGTTTDPSLGIQGWLDRYRNARTDLRGDDLVTRFYGVRGGHSPDVRAMVRSALAGHLVSVGLGYYSLQNPSKDVPDERLKRTGGHVVFLTGAASPTVISGVTAGLTIADPGTPSDPNETQSFYQRDQIFLEDATTQGFVNAGNRPYDAALHKVQGRNTYFDSWFSLAPKTLVYSPFKEDQIALRESLSFIRGVAAPRFRTGGPVVDAELLPHEPGLVFAIEGSSRIFIGDRVTGDRPAAIHTGLGEVRDVAFGGAEARLFVSDGRKVGMFDANGTQLRTIKAGAKIDELEYDIAGDRLVGLSAGSRQLLFFEEDLSKAGSASLPKRALDGRGQLSLAFAPNGTALIRRDGSDDLAKASFGGAKGRPAARVAQVKEDELPLAKRSKGLAVDDAGHLFISNKGEIVEFTASGKRVKDSRYAGVKANTVFTVARSFSNRDFSIIDSLDYVPEQYEPTWSGDYMGDEKGEAQGPEKPQS